MLVTVPAGAKSASFTVTAQRISKSTSVTLFATANGATVSTKLYLVR